MSAAVLMLTKLFSEGRYTTELYTTECQNYQKIWIWADLHQYDCDHYDSLACGPILQYSRVILFDRFWCGPMLDGVSLHTI